MMTTLQQLEEFRKNFKLTKETKKIFREMDINNPNFLRVERLISDMSEFVNYFYWCYRKNGNGVN